MEHLNLRDADPPVDEKKRRLSVGLPKISGQKLIVLALIAIAAMTAFNSYAVFSAFSPTRFPGSSLFTVTAQYQYGASPQEAVMTPGGTVPFTLTVSSSAGGSQRLALS